MEDECYSLNFMSHPVKLHIIMVGTAERTGQKLVHTFICANNTPRVQPHSSSVCGLTSVKTESHGCKWSRGGGGGVLRQPHRALHTGFICMNCRSSKMWHITRHRSNRTECKHQLGLQHIPVWSWYQMPSDQTSTLSYRNGCLPLVAQPSVPRL